MLTFRVVAPIAIILALTLSACGAFKSDSDLNPREKRAEDIQRQIDKAGCSYSAFLFANHHTGRRGNTRAVIYLSKDRGFRGKRRVAELGIGGEALVCINESDLINGTAPYIFVEFSRGGNGIVQTAHLPTVSRGSVWRVAIPASLNFSVYPVERERLEFLPYFDAEIPLPDRD